MLGLHSNRWQAISRVIKLLAIAVILLSAVLVPATQFAGEAEAADWLGTWAQRYEVTSDSTVIDADLTQFPITIFIDSTAGKGSTDVTAIFDELTSDANRFKIAVTDADGTTQLYVEIEKWDDANEVAVLHVSKAAWVLDGDADQKLYFYYDFAQDDNTTYVKDYNPNVWDPYFVGVWHMTEQRAPAVTITDNGAVFDADDVISGGGKYMEDCVVIKAQDVKFYMFMDGYTKSPSSNDDIYCTKADDAAFTTSVAHLGKIITRADTRIYTPPVYDPVRQEYILYLVTLDTSPMNTNAYYCSKANFEAGDAGAGDWVNAGAVLGAGGGIMYDIRWDSVESEWVAIFHTGATGMDLQYARSSDPRAAFTKDASAFVTMSDATIPGTWMTQSLSPPRGWWHGLDTYYLVFWEGLIAGSYWRTGAYFQSKENPEYFVPASTCPELGSGASPGYANPDCTLTEGGVNYLYFQTTKAGEVAGWYNQHVGTFTVGTSISATTQAKHNLVNSVDLDTLRAIKKAATEPTDTTGKVAQAQSFDGSNDYAQVERTTALEPTEAITVSCYFNLDIVVSSQPKTYPELVQKDVYADNQGYGSMFGKTENMIFFRAYINGSWRLVSYSAAGISAGTWYRHDGVYDGSYVRMYLNNSEVGTAVSVSGNITQNTANDLNFGAYSDGTGTPTTANILDGSMDEIRVSLTARADAWRKAEYNSLADNLLTWGSSELAIEITTLPATSVKSTSAILWGNNTGTADTDYVAFWWGNESASLPTSMAKGDWDNYYAWEETNTQGQTFYYQIAVGNLTSEKCYWVVAGGNSTGGDFDCGEAVWFCTSSADYDFGTVAVNTAYFTAIDQFQWKNCGTTTGNVTISSGVYMTGSGGNWTVSTDATNGASIVGLKAGLNDDDDTFDTTIKPTGSTPYNVIKANLAGNTTFEFGVWMLTPTSYSDGSEKVVTITLWFEEI